MSSLRWFIALLFASLSFSEAKVEFTHSTLYGIYDFMGVDEVPLPNCDFGCLIYTSTYQDLEPYMMNLVVYDPDTDTNRTLANLGLKFDPNTDQKLPLEITVNGSYSIYNLNDPKDTGTEITVWVIERSKALEIDYEIYDAYELNMEKRGNTVPKDVVMIMCVTQFRVVAQPGDANSYTARLTGFDNAAQDNPDLCVHAYETPINSKFDGFELHVDGPLISFVFANKKKVDLKGDLRYAVSGQRDMSKGGFIATSGWSLCERLGGDQVHLARFRQTGDVQEILGKPDYYNIVLDSYLDLDPELQMNVTDVTTGQIFPLAGNKTNIKLTLERTQDVEIEYHMLKQPQTFLIRHNAMLVEKATSTSPTVPTSTTPKPTSTSQKPTTSQTSPKPPSTTSAAGGTAVLAATGALMMLLLVI